MTSNGVIAVTLRYFTEFGKLALQKAICGGIYARVYCILVGVQCRSKEGSRSLSRLLMSFLYLKFCDKKRCEEVRQHFLNRSSSLSHLNKLLKKINHTMNKADVPK